MKSIILTFFIIVIGAQILKAADHYDTGDTLFIWAKSGLNLRSGPGKGFIVVTKIPYGKEVVILEKTVVSYNVMGVSSVENTYSKKTDPIIFKGNWVKITTSDGKIGFIIDQYILKFKPNDISGNFRYGLNLKRTSIDTVYQSPIINDGSGLNSEVKINFSHGIVLTESSGGYWGSSHYSIPNVTFEEVMIMFDSWGEFTVLRNWKKEIILSDQGICIFTIKQENGIITVDIECSC